MNVSFASRMPVMNNTRRLELEHDEDPWSGYADTMETDAPTRSSATREVRDDEFAAPAEMPNAWAAAHSRLQDRHNFLSNQAHEISRRSYAALNYGAFNPGFDPMMGMQPGFAPPYDPNMQPVAYGPPLPGQPMPGQPLPGQPMYGQPLAGQPFMGQPLPGQPLYSGQAGAAPGVFQGPPQPNGALPYGAPISGVAQDSWRASMANHSNLPSGPMYQPAAPYEPPPEPVNFDAYGWADGPEAPPDDYLVSSNA